VRETATSGANVVTRTFTTDEAGAIVKVTEAETGDATDETYLVTWNGHGDAIGLAEINPTDGRTPPGGAEDTDPLVATAEAVILGLRLDTGPPLASRQSGNRRLRGGPHRYDRGPAQPTRRGCPDHGLGLPAGGQ